MPELQAIAKGCSCRTQQHCLPIAASPGYPTPAIALKGMPEYACAPWVLCTIYTVRMVGSAGRMHEVP